MCLVMWHISDIRSPSSYMYNGPYAPSSYTYNISLGLFDSLTHLYLSRHTENNIPMIQGTLVLILTTSPWAYLVLQLAYI